MVLLLNSLYGFSDRMNTYRKTLSATTYPKQNTSYLGKWCLLRFIDESDREFLGTDANTLAINGINNRFYINKTYYPAYTGTNSGHATFFRVVRFDSVSPYRVILISLAGQVIVTTVEIFQNQLDLYSDVTGDIAPFIYREYQNVDKLPTGATLVTIEHTTDQTTFFNSYNNEKVHKFPIQDDEVQFRTVYTEYALDMSKDASFNNENMNIKNNWDWDEDTLAHVKETHPSMKGVNEAILKSFEQFYAMHGNSLVDNPRRTSNYGYLIRSDANAPDAHDVVAEVTVVDNAVTGVRFVTDQEARIYYNNETSIVMTASDMNTIYNTATLNQGS